MCIYIYIYIYIYTFFFNTIKTTKKDERGLEPELGTGWSHKARTFLFSSELSVGSGDVGEGLISSGLEHALV
jgi:hypothetical protein